MIWIFFRTAMISDILSSDTTNMVRMSQKFQIFGTQNISTRLPFTAGHSTKPLCQTVRVGLGLGREHHSRET